MARKKEASKSPKPTETSKSPKSTKKVLKKKTNTKSQDIKTTNTTKKRKNGRRKGAGFERDVAKILSAWWGCEFHRTPASGGLHWKGDNRVSGDIVAPLEGGEDFPFSIECKKVEGWNFEQVIKGTGDIPKWWGQCTKDAKDFEKVPLLVFTKNRSPIYFAMYWEDFEEAMEGNMSNYFMSLIHLEDGTKGCVGIGYFEHLTQVSKEKIVNIFND